MSNWLKFGLQQEDEPSVEKIVADLLSDESYQTELPPIQSEPDIGALAALFSSLIQIFVYFIFGAIVLFFLVLLIQHLSERRRRHAQNDAPKLTKKIVAGVTLEVDLADINAAAGMGNFAEALHLLLLGTFEELRHLAQLDLSPALTSREIVATMPLAEPARADLAALVNAVEISHFGETTPSEDDFLDCLQFHDRFVESLKQIAS